MPAHQLHCRSSAALDSIPRAFTRRMRMPAVMVSVVMIRVIRAAARTAITVSHGEIMPISWHRGPEHGRPPYTGQWVRGTAGPRGEGRFQASGWNRVGRGAWIVRGSAG